MRTAVKQKAVSRSQTIAPPVRGWIVNKPLAGGKPGGALVLENWFPLQTSARVRGGSQKYATVLDGSPVLSMFTYRSGSQELFFAGTETSIINISSTLADTIVSPHVFLTNPETGAVLTNPETGAYLTGDLRADSVVGQTSGYYISAMFGNAAGNFLSVVNGTDTPKIFDGAAWAAHTFTGSGLDTSDLSFVWSFASRLWYIEKNTLKVWYLDVDAINGTLTSFSLAGIFQEGGSLVLGGKWSLDAGDGLDDKWFVVSDQGEVAVYQGTDPGSADSWSKVGVYKITPPMGPKAIAYAGGDPLIGVEDGIVALSMSVEKDEAALSLAAVTKDIEPEWKKEVRTRAGSPWEIVKWSAMNMLIVSLPVNAGSTDAYCLVCNAETGAWTKYTGWDTQCLAVFNGNGYFASSTGKVYRMETGGTDDGVPYTCTYVGLPDYLKTPGVTKLVHSARVIVQSSFAPVMKASASVNYNVSLPVAPAPGPDVVTGARWDVARWDVDRWDSTVDTSIHTKWVSIGKSGFSVSPQIQVTCGFTAKPELELIATDVIFETGAVFV